MPGATSLAMDTQYTIVLDILSCNKRRYVKKHNAVVILIISHGY